MSLTNILGFFFTALTMFLSSSADVYLGRPVQCLLLSMTAVYLFFWTFQVALQAIPNACAMALISPFSQLQNHSQRQSWFFNVGLSFLTQRQNSRLKPRLDIQNYFWFNQSI